MAKTRYANQIAIRKKEIVKDADHPYTKISNEGLKKAMAELDGFKFRLWVYLCWHTQTDSFWDYSPQALINAAGGSRRSWDDAKKELQDLGYLQPVADGEQNEFEFYEIPVQNVMSLF